MLTVVRHARDLRQLPPRHSREKRRAHGDRRSLDGKAHDVRHLLHRAPGIGGSLRRYPRPLVETGRARDLRPLRARESGRIEPCGGRIAGACDVGARLQPAERTDRDAVVVRDHDVRRRCRGEIDLGQRSVRNGDACDTDQERAQEPAARRASLVTAILRHCVCAFVPVFARESAGHIGEHCVRGVHVRRPSRLSFLQGLAMRWRKMQAESTGVGFAQRPPPAQ